MSNDSISDMLTRVRNAQRAGHHVVRVSDFKVNHAVLDVLRREGMIESFQVVALESKTFPKSEIEVSLKYFGNGEPAMRKIKRISKPGRRLYRSVDDIPRESNGLGVTVISTSQGILSDREAKAKKIGGEVLAVIGS